jgi:hypothetical protein
MDDKITIIEGPPPTFELLHEGWTIGLNEGPNPYELVLTRLRTFNSAALVERCRRAWKEHSTVYLEFRDELGIEEKLPIMAARTLETEDGDLLLLWVRRDPEEDGAESDDFESDESEDESD